MSNYRWVYFWGDAKGFAVDWSDREQWAIERRADTINEGYVAGPIVRVPIPKAPRPKKGRKT